MDPGWRYGKHMPRVLTFALNGTAAVPDTPPPDYSVHPIDNPGIEIDRAAADRGENLWNHSCIVCHGVAAASAGTIAPDLRESPLAASFASLDAVLSGALRQHGMPSFPALTHDERTDIFMYIRRVARAASLHPAPSTSRRKPGGTTLLSSSSTEAHTLTLLHSE
jgi:mono/diheme cytochrome c family protein